MRTLEIAKALPPKSSPKLKLTPDITTWLLRIIALVDTPLVLTLFVLFVTLHQSIFKAIRTAPLDLPLEVNAISLQNALVRLIVAMSVVVAITGIPVVVNGCELTQSGSGGVSSTPEESHACRMIGLAALGVITAVVRA
jgi:hypothetical protein